MSNSRGQFSYIYIYIFETETEADFRVIGGNQMEMSNTLGPLASPSRVRVQMCTL